MIGLFMLWTKTGRMMLAAQGFAVWIMLLLGGVVFAMLI